MIPRCSWWSDRRPWLLALCLCVACDSCSRRDDLDGRRRPIAGLSEPPAERSLLAAGDEPVYDFSDNRAAAVVSAGGALIAELGMADGAKYTEGGYRSAWQLHADGEVRAALVPGLQGVLWLPLGGEPGEPGGQITRETGGQITRETARETARESGDGGATADGQPGALEIAFLARAARARQLVSVFLNERRVGDVSMPTESWQTYRIRVPASAAAGVVPGENKLRMYFRHTGEIAGQRTAAAVARVAVGPPGMPVDAPAVRVEPVTHGGESLRAIRAAGPARLSYYLRIPTGSPALVFAVAAPSGRASARVSLSAAPAAGGEPSPTALWEGEPDQTWSPVRPVRPVRIDLAGRAGELVRIDFSGDAALDWGRPQLVRARALPLARPPGASSGPSGSPGTRTTESARALPIVDHVIVWVISALRDDHFAGAVPTPAFARAAGRGVRFSNTRTASPAPGPAHVALLTGRHPTGGQVPAGGATVAEQFARAGFATALISGNGFVNDEAGFARGFAIYDNPMRRRLPHRAPILWQRARRVLQKHIRGRTFLYVATVEPHLPYTPSDETLAAEWDGPAPIEPAQTTAVALAAAEGRAPLSAADASFLRALYRAEVRDADAALAGVLADLESLGVADRTALIVVGDHGQELGERGVFGHGDSLRETALRVPLVIAGPGLPRGAADDRPVEFIDVAATALELAGLTPGPDLQGTSLLARASGPAGKDLRVPAGDPAAPPDSTPGRASPGAASGSPRAFPRPVFAHLPGYGRAVVVGSLKLVVPLVGPHALYDLEKDPGELRDLAGERPFELRYLRNVFGLGVAFQGAWTIRRWGTPLATTAAFAADQGQ